MSDHIKREDAIEAMKQRYNDILRTFKRKVKVGEKAIVMDMIGCVKALPSTDRPQGEWIDEADKYDASFGIHDYRCSNCNSYADEYIGGHEWYTADKPNFCPNCGADMRGVDDETD